MKVFKPGWYRVERTLTGVEKCCYFTASNTYTASCSIELNGQQPQWWDAERKPPAREMAWQPEFEPMPSIPSAAHWDDYACTTAVWETQADRAPIQGIPMRSFFRRQWHWFRRFAVLAILFGLTGCEEKPKPAERAYVTMTGHNYTEDYIHQFYVEGAWGGNVRAYSGGGGFVCCVGVPVQWRPGLTATVRWTTSASRNKPYTGETWHEQVVAVEPYGLAGSRMNVHFLADKHVRLIVSNKGPGAENYPGPPQPEKPADWPYGRYEWPKP